MNDTTTVRECGCSEVLDTEWDAWVIAEQCAEHANISAKAEAGVQRLLDHELDFAVHAAAGGKRVHRIYPPDPTR